MKILKAPSLSLEKQQILERQLFNENIQRCKLFAKIVILFEAILIMMNIASRLSPFTFDLYLMMYVILLIVSITMLLFMHWYEKGNTNDHLRYKLYQKGLLAFVIFFLVWGAVVSLADQQQYGNIMAFAVNVMCVSILFHASNKTILQLYILPVAVLYIGLPFVQSSSTIIMGHYINLTVFLFFCWLASRMLYTSYYTTFYNKMLLTEMNGNLALKIEENEKMNQELEKANAQLKQLSIIDELTKVPNRRGFQEYIRDAIHQTNEIRKLTLMMIDIDAFKLFNDQYGHLDGDKIIQAVAQKIYCIIDTAARFGGEEFIVSIFDRDELEVYKLAEVIRLSVLEMKITHEPSPVSEYVTVSIGIAIGDVRNVMDVGALMEKADNALYKAKSLGRNRVEKDIEGLTEKVMTV